MINIRKLEAELWESADLLRQGSKLTSSQYCMPVLALLFLRYAYSRYKMVEAEILQNRAALNFMQMGMKKGDVLVWKEDPSITISVCSERTVMFKGEEKAISAVTRDLKGSKWYVAPGSYWLYNDRLLNEIYDETYPVEE